MLARNLGSSFESKTIGVEEQPVLQVDDFFREAHALKQYAVDRPHAFTVDKGHYPGLRLSMPKTYLRILVAELKHELEKTFAVDFSRFDLGYSVYSIITKARSELEIYQRIPHFDEPKKDCLAFIHYLSEDSGDGTSFYRHRSTGFEYVDRDRYQAYSAKLKSEMNQRAPGFAYINGDDVFFERIVDMPAAYNRLYVYRTSSLHSASIPEDYNLSTNPATGRLTVVSFLRFK